MNLPISISGYLFSFAASTATPIEYSDIGSGGVHCAGAGGDWQGTDHRAVAARGGSSDGKPYLNMIDNGFNSRAFQTNILVQPLIEQRDATQQQAYQIQQLQRSAAAMGAPPGRAAPRFARPDTQPGFRTCHTIRHATASRTLAGRLTAGRQTTSRQPTLSRRSTAGTSSRYGGAGRNADQKNCQSQRTGVQQQPPAQAELPLRTCRRSKRSIKPSASARRRQSLPPRRREPPELRQTSPDGSSG